MIQIDKVLISEDLLDVHFLCNLNACKGACCVAGDAGAPLEEEEIAVLEDLLDIVKPYLTTNGRKVIETLGVFDYDAQGNFVTPLVNGVECAFTNFDNGVAYCAIEKAFDEGKIDFQKPVSCHLYPVRISKLSDFEAVNYHKWSICKAALKAGKRKSLPLYKFLKEPLVRKFGATWYQKLEKSVNKEN